jgi:hypothetical protein
MPATEVIVTTGERLQVEGSPQEIEASISAAARGSILELVWLTEAGSSQPIGLNPGHVVAVRASEAS